MRVRFCQAIVHILIPPSATAKQTFTILLELQPQTHSQPYRAAPKPNTKTTTI